MLRAYGWLPLTCAELALQVSTTVKIMLDILQGQRGDAGSRYVALLALGEVGRTTDLSGYDGVSQAVTEALEGSSLDELRTAASSALGGLAVGSTSAFLPFILQQIQAQVCSQQWCPSPPTAHHNSTRQWCVWPQTERSGELCLGPFLPVNPIRS